MHHGFVSLVGAGPGDPELITLKGLRRLRAAEVVVYDALVSAELLDECRADAELVYVGKRAGLHCMPQTAINALARVTDRTLELLARETNVSIARLARGQAGR